MWMFLVTAILAYVAYRYFFSKPDQLHTIKGKRVLVTGSSTGIGEQLAYHYARLGATVVVTARREKELNKVVEKCRTLSPVSSTQHFAVPADMSKAEDTQKVIEQAVKHLGGLDILVLNHVTGYTLARFTGTKKQIEDLEFDMDVNFRSYVRLTSHALPHLTSTKGSIIAVNALVGKMAQPCMASYSASKHAMAGFFNSLHSQHLAFGPDVSVTSCYPGLTGSENLVSRLNHYTEGTGINMTPQPPEDTALDIVKGGANRVAEVYTPFWHSLGVVLFHRLCPSLLDYLGRRSVRGMKVE